MHPAEGFVNPVTLAIELNPGFALSALDSPYHRVDVAESADHRYTVRLADGPVPANRDFELVWTPDVAAAPGAAVFAERKDGQHLRAGDARAAACRERRAAHTARGGVHHRHVRVDGRHVDRAGEASAWNGARPPAAGRSLQRDRVQFGHPRALRRADAGRPRDAPAGQVIRRGLAGARRHRDEGRARSGAHARCGAGFRAPGRVPDRWRRRQRRRAARADPRTRRRPAAVHDRDRFRAERVLPHEGGAIRPRHVHVHRRRARGRRQDGRALRQARKPGADRHCRRVAGDRRGLAARAGRPLRRGTDRRRRPDRCAGRDSHDHRAPRRRAVAREPAGAGQRERAGHRRAVGAREDRCADRRAEERRARGRRAQGDRRRRARASPREQVHEPGRGRRHADGAAGHDPGDRGAADEPARRLVVRRRVRCTADRDARHAALRPRTCAAAPRRHRAGHRREADSRPSRKETDS